MKSLKKRDYLKRIVLSAVIAGLYVALTFLTYPVSYGDLGIELRISEILVLLCFFNADFIASLAIGCFIANFFGPMGIIDAIFGSFATILSCICISKSKNIFVASIFPIVFNGLIVVVELCFMFEIPIVYAILGVAIGEIISVTCIGCPVMLLLKKNKTFNDLLIKENIEC